MIANLSHKYMPNELTLLSLCALFREISIISHINNTVVKKLISHH